MGYVIRMPQLGMSMDEGTVVEWLVDEGEAVEAGEVVAVVESEKTSAEVEAREGGSLGQILVDERTPMKRVAEREEIVGAAIYLASDAASFTTGEVLRIDGGYTESGL